MEKPHHNLIIAGVDEAGRGPLAGPVYAAAVILDRDKPVAGLKDSKLLTAAKREAFFESIIAKALAYSISFASVLEIDTLNILKASLLAMQRAVANLTLQPQLLYIDGTFSPEAVCATQTVVNGDQLVPEVSAASILAKVARDREMALIDTKYPDYGFAKHKGYGTREHLNALKKFGVLPIHRKSFAPVKLLMTEVN